MTISDWGAIGELLGAVATVATLFYLALQIRENTRQNRRASVDSTIDRIVRWQARRTSTPELLNAWIEGQKNYATLPEKDRNRFDSLMAEALATAETTLEAEKFNSIKPETVARTDSWIRRLLSSKGSLDWWHEQGRHIFASDFVARVDQALTEQPDETVS